MRVHIGRGMNAFRITEESARAFVERLKSKYEMDAYLERAAKHAAHMRNAVPEPAEVMLDAEEITRQASARTPEPKAKPTLDDCLAEKRDAEAPALHPVSHPADWDSAPCGESEAIAYIVRHTRYNPRMFVGGIEFFFGLVAGLVLLILAIVGLPKIGSSAVQFCKGQASTFAIAVWVIVIVGVVTAVALVLGAFR